MSNIQDNLKMKGRLQVSLNGEVVRDVDNLVVTAGKNYVADPYEETTLVSCHTWLLVVVLQRLQQETLL
jgi:hypothetical protein